MITAPGGMDSSTHFNIAHLITSGGRRSVSTLQTLEIFGTILLHTGGTLMNPLVDLGRELEKISTFASSLSITTGLRTLRLETMVPKSSHLATTLAESFKRLDNVLLHTQFSQLETIEIVLYVTPRSMLSGLMALSDEALEEIQKEIPTFFAKTIEIRGVLVKCHVFNLGTDTIERLPSGFWEGMRSTTTKGRAEIKSGC